MSESLLLVSAKRYWEVLYKDCKLNRRYMHKKKTILIKYSDRKKEKKK